MVKIDEIELKPLKEGGIYIVKFKDCDTYQGRQWMKVLTDRLAGRNITLVPEFDQCFEIVGEPIEKIK